MSPKEWGELYTCSLNVVRKYFRNKNIYLSEDEKNDIASDVMANCAHYIDIKGTKPSGNLSSFVCIYGLKPVLFNPQRIKEDQTLSIDALGTFDKDIDGILEGAQYEDGVIKLREAL